MLVGRGAEAQSLLKLTFPPQIRRSDIFSSSRLGVVVAAGYILTLSFVPVSHKVSQLSQEAFPAAGGAGDGAARRRPARQAVVS